MISNHYFLRTLKLLTFLIADLCFSFQVRSQELQIVKGSTRATIVIGASASPPERYAAEELQRAIRLMSGANLNIAELGQVISGPRIVIGTPDSHSGIQALAAQMGLSGTNEEQIALLRDSNTLYLAGKTPRAALYATYTFLETQLGARWFWPGASGEFLPRQRNICVGQLNISQAPALKFRSVAVTGPVNGDPDTDTWMARNRMNIVSIPAGSDPDGAKTKPRKQKGFLTRIAGHNIVLPDTLLQAHPEYIAEVGGVRQINTGGPPSHLCWSNTNVQTQVANMISGWWDQNPFNDIVHFYPVDQPQFCECSNCAAMGDVSTRWQKFSDLVIAKVNLNHPGKKYWTYAYQAYRPAPLVTPAPFDYIGYTLYNGSYRNMLSGNSTGNSVPKTEMAAWINRGGLLGIRGYEYIIFKDPMIVPMVSWEMDQISWAKNNNLIGVMSELPPFGYPKNTSLENTYWTCNRITLYAAAKAMWNSNTTPQQVVSDWCSRIYGPAGKAMGTYYWDMEAAWKNAPGDITYFLNAPADEADNFLSPALFQKLFNHLTAARTAASGVADPTKRNNIQQQINLESRMLENWQKTYHFKTGLANHFKTNVIKTALVNDSLWLHTPTLPMFKDSTGNLATAQTSVAMAWTSTALVLKVVCKDNNMANLKAKYLLQDENVWADDCVELFIQPNPLNPTYMRMAVNAKATKYDAKTDGGLNFDKTWNPAWTASSSLQDSSWTLNIEIPFISLGISAQDSTQFKLAIRRSMPSRSANSGWPDFSGSPGGFATATLMNQPVPQPKRIVFYDAGGDSGGTSVEFQQQNWDIARVSGAQTDLQNQLNQHTDVLLIRYTSGPAFALSTSFMSTQVRNFIQDGGIVIISAVGTLPIDQWFSGTPAVQWSGTSYDPLRKSTYVLPGNWLTVPNNITTVLNNGVTPTSGYTPLTTGWETMARIRMLDTTEKPYLLNQKIGSGLLVLSSSAMGYSGGYEMFGNRNTLNIVKLAENLIQKNLSP